MWGLFVNKGPLRRLRVQDSGFRVESLGFRV